MVGINVIGKKDPGAFPISGFVSRKSSREHDAEDQDPEPNQGNHQPGRHPAVAGVPTGAHGHTAVTPAL
jgi:hypothetical protein